MLYVAVGFVVAVFAAWWWRREHNRTARLRACAQERRLRFSRHDILDVHQRYGSLALMRAGHSRRAWDTFFGMHECGVWMGFFTRCDMGFGADRVPMHCCVAAVEMHTGVEMVCVPAAIASSELNPWKTAIDYLSFVPVEAGPSGGVGSHVLYVRRASVMHSPVVTRFMASIARHPGDCAWELGENVLLAVRPVSSGEFSCDVVSAMLDAVADVAARLAEVIREGRLSLSSSSPDGVAAAGVASAFGGALRAPHVDAGVASDPAPVRGVVAVLSREGRLLVIRRAPHILAGGAWCFPGGAIEPGETIADALVREMQEEVGLAVWPVRPLWQCTLDEGRLELHWWLVEPAAAGRYDMRLNPDEVAEARWLTPAEIRELPGLLESNRAFLRDALPPGLP